MALEDAVVLARALATRPVLPALAAYEAARKPRATRLQQAAARNGRRFHAYGALDGWIKATALGAASRFAPGWTSRLQDWIYAYDPATAPLAPS